MARRPLLHTFLRAVLACLAGLLLTAGAQAQAFRTYLSSSGADNPTCGVTTPCRLLPAALTAVANGGEVWMLNSANYNTGPVAITKSVTILAVPGALGSVVALGGNAIDIATANVKVALRNLVIVPYLGNFGHGINMTAGASLTVEDCLIANLFGKGIVVSTPATLRVTNSTIRDNNYGLLIQNGARAYITGATISGSVRGVAVDADVAALTTAEVADSTIEANDLGVHADASQPGTAVVVSVVDSRIVGHGSSTGLTAYASSGGTTTLSSGNNRISFHYRGIESEGVGAKVWASGNVVTSNTSGLVILVGGIIESAGDNAVRNNGTNTSGTITVVPKL